MTDRTDKFTLFALAGYPITDGSLAVQMYYRDTDGCHMDWYKRIAYAPFPHFCSDYQETDGIPSCTVHSYGEQGNVHFQGGPQPKIGIGATPLQALDTDDFEVRRGYIVPLEVNVASGLLDAFVDTVAAIFDDNDATDDQLLAKAPDLIKAFELLDASRSAVDASADTVLVPCWALRMLRQELVGDQAWRSGAKDFIAMLMRLEPLLRATGKVVNLL